jgi:hypothetical protein
MLVVLGLVGTPWALVVMPSRSAIALAPAFGLGALALISVLVDAVGLRLSSAGGWVAFGLPLGSGLVLATYRRRTRSA